MTETFIALVFPALQVKKHTYVGNAVALSTTKAIGIEIIKAMTRPDNKNFRCIV